MNIIVIGGSGQLGTDCQKVFRDRHQTEAPTHSELDICNEQALLEYLEQKKPDTVVNCAAYTAVDRCETEIEAARKLNAEGPAAMARACQKTGTRLIQISTDYVFDGTKEVPKPYLEADAVGPVSQYGKTKLAGEQLVQKYCSNAIILRTAWLYSAEAPNFLKTMLRLTLADPKAVRKVVNDQHGSLTWTETLARQIEALLTSDIRGIVHATAEGYTTWYEGACYFLERLGIPHNLTPCSTADYPTPATRPTNSILENSVLKKNDCNLFADWREDIDRYIALFGEQLIASARQ